VAVARGRRKKEEKKCDVPTYLPFFEFFWRFSGLILENIFVVFLGSSSSCRETGKKRDKKKVDGKRRQEKSVFSWLFRPKVFDMDFPQKVLWCF
jgi:hypothetical protein